MLFQPQQVLLDLNVRNSISCKQTQTLWSTTLIHLCHHAFHCTTHHPYYFLRFVQCLACWLLLVPLHLYLTRLYAQYQVLRRCLLLLLDFDFLLFLNLLGFASSLSTAEDELDIAPSSLLSLD